MVSSIFSYSVIKTASTTGQTGTDLLDTHIEKTVPVPHLKGIAVGTKSKDTSASSHLATIKLAVETRLSSPVEITTESLLIGYRDGYQYVPDMTWAVRWLRGNGDLLDRNELAEFTLDLSKLTPKLGAARPFTIEIKPLAGGPLAYTFATPQGLDDVTELPGLVR